MWLLATTLADLMPDRAGRGHSGGVAMSNGPRHTWGFFAGVVLTAALVALLIFGTYRLQHGYVTQFHKQDKWIGGGLLAGAAIVFAILVASRLSPLASLIRGPGLPPPRGGLFLV